MIITAYRLKLKKISLIGASTSISRTGVYARRSSFTAFLRNKVVPGRNGITNAREFVFQKSQLLRNLFSSILQQELFLLLRFPYCLSHSHSVHFTLRTLIPIQKYLKIMENWSCFQFRAAVLVL